MSPVKLERRGGVAWVLIDNPPVNALSTTVRTGLKECIQQADADPDADAIIIACEGRTFIAGADINELGLAPAQPTLPELVNIIESCNKPVLAAIHGNCLGGGLEVAMACHYRLALSTASVGLPEVRLGLLPGASGTQRLPRLAGAEIALQMMLSGDSVTAEYALQAGILDEVIDTDDLRQEAARIARSLSGKSVRRVRDMKVGEVDEKLFADARLALQKKSRGLFSPQRIIQCVEIATKTGFDEGCRLERELFRECQDSPQARGLIYSFFAHRAVNKIPGINKQSPARPVKKIAVLGAGTMGAGIAYNCLTAGHDVFLLDNDDAGLARGRDTIRGLFEGGVKRGKVTPAAMQDGLSRLLSGTDYAALHDVDLVIEAVFEDMEIKKNVFCQLDQVCKRGAILATNTSTLDVDEIAAATDRPRDVIGLHFFSPAHVMRLLEIVRGAKTSTEVLATTLALGRKLGKIGVVVGNCYGFVGNRMLYSYGRENQFLLLEGAAPEYIDQVLYEWGMAMGPNAVGDLAGLDVGYKARKGRSDLPADARFYRVADMLVEAGRFGQKTGKGMFSYAGNARQPSPDPEVQALIRTEATRLGVPQRDIAAQEIIERCVYGLIAEGARILEDGIAQRASDIDVIWVNGYGFPAYRGGPMHYADTVGLDHVLTKIREFRDRFGAEYWETPPLLRELAAKGNTFAEFDKAQSQVNT